MLFSTTTVNTNACASKYQQEVSYQIYEDYECNVRPIALQRPLVTDLRWSGRVAWPGLGRWCWREWSWDCCPGEPWKGRRHWLSSSGSCCRLLALQRATQTHSLTASSQPQLGLRSIRVASNGSFQNSLTFP